MTAKKFEQAILDFFQAKVLLVQNALRFLQINLVLGFLFPRQVQNPVEIIARDAVFGGGGRRLIAGVPIPAAAALRASSGIGV